MKIIILILAVIRLAPIYAQSIEEFEPFSNDELVWQNYSLSPKTYSIQNKRGLIEMKQEHAHAQKKLERQRAYVDQLEKEIATLEIEQIQEEISQLNKESVTTHELTHEQSLALFCHQREILGGIIRNHPACRVHAQEVLDQILSLITQISNER